MIMVTKIVEKWFDTPVCPVRWLERFGASGRYKKHAQCTKELLSELSNHMIRLRPPSHRTNSNDAFAPSNASC